MDQVAVGTAIAAAITKLQAKIETQQTVLKQALDKEFDALRQQSADANTAVRETFTLADRQVRDDYQKQQVRIRDVEMCVADQELKMNEQTEKLRAYEKQQANLFQTRGEDLRLYKECVEKSPNDTNPPCRMVFQLPLRRLLGDQGPLPTRRWTATNGWT